MEDAGFIIGSYVLTFAAVALLSWRYVRSGRRLRGTGAGRGEILALTEQNES